MLEPIRIVSDWLARGTNGTAGALNGPGSVNALRAGVPRDAGDAALAAATIYDETRDPWVARRSRPAEGLAINHPALVVYAPTGVDFDGEVGTVIRDGMVSIAIMYLDDAASSAVALTASLYYARAVVRSLKLLNDNANEAFRVRNSVALWLCASLKIAKSEVEAEGLTLTNGVLVTYHVRDLAP